MRLCALVQDYPSEFKPYYDSQFLDFMRRGVDVIVFSTGTSSRNYTVNTGDVIYYPTTLRTLYRAAVPSLHALTHLGRSRKKFLAVLRREGGWKKRVLDAARAAVIETTFPDLFLIHGLGTALFFPWLKDAYPSVPVTMYYHGGEVPSVRKWSDVAVREAFESVDVVFTNTQSSAKSAVSRGCPTEKVEILPVGFALEDFTPSQSILSDGPFEILSAGRMSEEKGLPYALEAVALLVERGHHRIHYSLAGDGYMRPKLETFVRDHKLEPYVTFLGTLSTQDLLKEMDRASLLLLPSIQVGESAETQACAVQEALLMRCLVIVSKIGGVPESIPPEMQDFIVPPGNSDALADAIERVIYIHPVDRYILSDIGRCFVAARYNIRDLNARLLTRALAAAPSPLLPLSTMEAI